MPGGPIPSATSINHQQIMATKKKTIDPAQAEQNEKLATAYYDGMRQQKVSAGLKLEDALEVTARQRAEDEANGVTPWLDDAAPEEIPES